MRKVLFIILLLFISNNAFSNELRIGNSNITWYPEKSIEFYYYDGNWDFFSELSKDNLKLEVDNVQITEFELFKPTKVINSPLSLLFSIDISEINSKNLDVIKNNILKLEKYLPDNNIEFAIQIYNSEAFILQDFTTDFKQIIRSINIASAYGVSNFNTGFLSNNTGSIDLSKKSSFNPVIINFTHGLGYVDSNSVTNAASKSGTSIYSIIFNEQVSKSFQSISDKTNGKSFNFINPERMLSDMISILNKESGVDPFRIRYKLADCQSQNLISLTVNNSSNSKYIAKYTKDKLPYIQVVPTSINYGKVPIGEEKKTFFTAIARNSDINLIDISFDTTTYSIEQKYKDIILYKDNPKLFELKLKSKSTDYSYSELKFISDACSQSKISIVYGLNEGEANNTPLEVIFPNGNEIFYPGQNINLKWDGVVDSQQVIIDYSSDNGQKWNVISENAINKMYKWNVPNLISNDMLLRVSIPNGIIGYENIKYVKDASINNKIQLTALSKDSRLAGISLQDGSIFIWDLDSNKIKSQLRDKNIGIATTDIAFGKKNNLFAAAFGKDNEYNIVYWDAENTLASSSRSFSNKPVDLQWSNNGISLLIGFENGNVSEWNTATNTLTQLTKFDRVDLLAECNSINIIAVASNNKIYLIDNLGNRLDSIAVPTQVLDLDWNPNGNKLSVVYDFSDLRIFRADVQGGSYKLLQEPRITRTNLTNIESSSWVTNNSIIINPFGSNMLEYWNTNSSLIFDFEIHKNDVKSISSNNKYIISASDTSFALVWNVDDYPFNFKTLDKDTSDMTWSIKPIKITQKSIELGDICLNNEYTFENSEAYKNTSAFKIQIDSIVSMSNQIRLLTNFPIELENNQSINLKFVFQPNEIGIRTNFIVVYRGNVKDTILVKSNNLKPQYNLLTNRVIFDNVLANTKVNKNFEILSNIDTKNLSFDKIELVFGNDYFIILGSKIVNITQNGKLTVDIEFSPKSSGTFSGLLKLTSADICSPIYIPILGTVSDSKLEYSKVINFGTVNCSETSDTTFYIKNLSSSSIDIREISLSGSQNIFKILSNIPSTISAGDSLLINLDFENGPNGIFNTDVILKTNLLNKDSVLTVQIIGIRDSINLELLSSRLDFGTVNLSSKSTNQIQVLNKSLSDYTFSIPKSFGLFRLLTATPPTIASGETSTLEFEFEGYDKDTLIKTLFLIDSSCNSKFYIPISANISNGVPILDYKDTLDLGTVNCNQELVYNITLSNIGKSNLIIDSLVISDLTDEFSFGNNYKDISIPPNESELFDLVYNSYSIGKKLVTVTIYSNSKNSMETIVIILNQNKTELMLLSPNILFEGLRSNKKYSKVIEVENIGNTIITPQYVDNTNFIIDSIIPNIIFPDEKAKVYITFLGGVINTSYNGELILIDECENNYSINATANVGGNDYVTIKPDDIEAKTGDLINLNIRFVNSTSVPLVENDTISTKLILNSTILSPINEIHKGEIDKFGNRIVDLRIPIINNPIIYQIPMIVTLGDTSYSEIKLIESTHQNDDFYIDDISSGSVMVTNIETIPTDRYIEGKGRAYLSETIPSPITNQAKISYGVIESTIVIISLYDLSGKKLEELVNKFHTPGEYELEINPHNLASGNYLYKLETPSMEIIKKMTIIH